MPNQLGARPLGTLTRHPADWFSDYLYSAGSVNFAQPVGPGELWSAYGLYNQDQGGRVLKIYGATVFSEGGGGMGIYFVRGTFGTAVGNALPIRPDYPLPNVTTYQTDQQTAVGATNPFLSTLGTQYGLLSASGFDSETILSPFPLFIVPTGYSIVASDTVSSFPTGMFWWFQMASR